MRETARTRANRCNARRSTGPKTEAGKRVVARNALRHGLAVPVERDAVLAPEIDRLARLIAGEGPANLRLELARQVAECQFDLMRIRSARKALLNDPRERVQDDSDRIYIQAIKAVEREYRIDNARYFKRLDAAANDQAARAQLDQDIKDAWEAFLRLLAPYEMQRQLAAASTLEEGFGVLAPKLARLDRYERRALSRRKRAMRDFESLA